MSFASVKNIISLKIIQSHYKPIHSYFQMLHGMVSKSAFKCLTTYLKAAPALNEYNNWACQRKFRTQKVAVTCTLYEARCDEAKNIIAAKIVSFKSS